MIRIWCFHFDDSSSVPGWGTEILQAARHSQKNKKIENITAKLKRLNGSAFYLSKLISLAIS